MSTARRPEPVRQLRLVVEVEDYDAAVAFFRDALGLPEQAAFSGGDDARVVILEAGTRPRSNWPAPAHRRFIDEVEVGRQVAPRFPARAFEVDDDDGEHRATGRGRGGRGRPTDGHPWQSLNSRLDAPGDLHITLFQEGHHS